MLHEVFYFKALNVDNTYATVYWDDARSVFEVTTSSAATGPEFLQHDKPDNTTLPYQYCAGSTLHYFTAAVNFPYANHFTIENATECQVRTCTLKVRLPLEVTPASSIDAPDGKVLINYDGYGVDVQYSLDNNTWQSSNEFTGLAPGTYMAYIRNQDPTSLSFEQCKDQSQFVVGYNVSYRPRFCTTFGNILDTRDYTLHITQKNYSGACDNVQGLSSAMVVSYSSPREAIVPSKATISLIARSLYHYLDLYSADERAFRVNFYENEVLEWRGWMMPEIWSQNFQDEGFAVQMVAADGLATLKNYPYVDKNANRITGKRRFIDIIFDCLDKLELEIPLQTGIDILEVKMRDTIDVTDTHPIIADPLYQLTIDTANFVDEKDKVWDCHKVLTSLLNTFEANIFQSGGKWVIEALDAKRTPVFCTKYNADRTFAGYEIINYVQERRLPNAGHPIFVSGPPELSISPAAKMVAINSDLVVVDNIIKNGYFPNSAFDSNNKLIDFIGGAPAERIVLGDNKNAVKLGVANSFNNALYLETKPVYLVADGSTSLQVRINYQTDKTEQNTSALMFFKLDGGGYSFQGGEFGWVAARPDSYYFFYNEQGQTPVTFELQTPPIPATGNYTLRVYQVAAGENPMGIHFVQYNSVGMTLLPGGKRPLEEQSVSAENPARYTWVPDAKEVLFTDVPVNPNYANIFKNYLEVGPEQTTLWHYRGITNPAEQYPLNVMLITQDMYNLSRPIFNLRGTLRGYFRYVNLLREPWAMGRLFYAEELSIDYEQDQSSGSFVELITTLDVPPGYLMQETRKRLLLQTGGGIKV